MLRGIGGASMFMPIFLIVFPLLGPEFAIAGPIAAIGVALLTEAFGFSSDLIGYLRRHLIDFKVEKSLIIIAVPSAVAGSFLSQYADPDMLKIMYGTLMLILTYIMLRRPTTKEKVQITKDTLTSKFEHIKHERTITYNEGNSFKYPLCHTRKGKAFTGIG